MGLQAGIADPSWRTQQLYHPSLGEVAGRELGMISYCPFAHSALQDTMEAQAFSLQQRSGVSLGGVLSFVDSMMAEICFKIIQDGDRRRSEWRCGQNRTGHELTIADAG